MKLIFILYFLLLVSPLVFAQEYRDSISYDPEIKITAFVDAYYSYDFNQPEQHTRPSFVYNHNRHNEFNVNLALIRAGYEAEKFRVKLSLMAGTYTQTNLQAEPVMLRNIFEASVGMRLSKKMWLDAGIFPSHIGYESAISKDNLNLTRSIMADNTPYYETGVKLNYEFNKKWNLTFLVVNGWQNIQESDHNSNKAVGIQLQYKPSENTLFNYSNFAGNEMPDTAKLWRYFHNFYVAFKPHSKNQTALLFDFGMQQKPLSNSFSTWWSSAILTRHSLSDKLALSGRIESYYNKDGIVIGVVNFNTIAGSLGIDHSLIQNVWLRMEGKYYYAEKPVFVRDQQNVYGCFVATGSLSVTY